MTPIEDFIPAATAQRRFLLGLLVGLWLGWSLGWGLGRLISGTVLQLGGTLGA